MNETCTTSQAINMGNQNAMDVGSENYSQITDHEEHL